MLIVFVCFIWQKMIALEKVHANEPWKILSNKRDKSLTRKIINSNRYMIINAQLGYRKKK